MAHEQPFVQTVKGPVDPAVLGETLLHEHLVADWSQAKGQAPPLSSVSVVDQIVECLAPAHDAGIGTIVDVSPESYGLAPLMLRLVADQTPMHVVAADRCLEAPRLAVARLGLSACIPRRKSRNTSRVTRATA